MIRLIKYYQQATEMAPKSMRWAYLSPLAHRWDEPSVDSSLIQSFLWCSLGEAHQRNSNYWAASEIYDSAIAKYKIAMEMVYNSLWWKRSGITIDLVWLDEFQFKHELPKPVLWVALAEAYRRKGDVFEALQAFRKSHILEPNNPWLESMIGKLEASVGVPI
jgi:tetratricopeptide (TPR) repeat protein